MDGVQKLGHEDVVAESRVCVCHNLMPSTLDSEDILKNDEGFVAAADLVDFETTNLAGNSFGGVRDFQSGPRAGRAAGGVSSALSGFSATHCLDSRNKFINTLYSF